MAAEDWRKVISDAQTTPIVGKTTSKEVEDFFKARNLKYSFITRDADALRAPHFPRSSVRAVGFYVSQMRNVRTAWLILYWESIDIDVEVDDENLVSKVQIMPWYTGL